MRARPSSFWGDFCSPDHVPKKKRNPPSSFPAAVESGDHPINREQRGSAKNHKPQINQKFKSLETWRGLRSSKPGSRGMRMNSKP